MKKKISLLRIPLVVFIFTLGFLWSKYYHHNLKKEKYPHRIGYINNYTELDSIEKHAKKPLHGYYSSSAPDIYKGSKYQFRKKYSMAFVQKNTTTTGTSIFAFISVIQERFSSMRPKKLIWNLNH